MDILTLKNNSYCSERVSPRRLRGNKILPPECHYVLQSYCSQRISPRRQRNGCEEFVEDVLLANIETSLTTPSSPTLTTSSFTSQSIQKEETPEIQGVTALQGVSVSQGVSASQGVSENQEMSENQEVSASQGVSVSQGVSASQGVSENQEMSENQEVSASQEVSVSQGVSVSQIPQIDDQSSSENISEVSQVEAPEPSSSPLTGIIEDPLKYPLPFRGRGDYIYVLDRIQKFKDEMIAIEDIEPHVPQRDLVIDIVNITSRFEIIMQEGRFEKYDQEYLFEYLDHLSESTTEVLQKNIDIKEIKQKTIEAYKDAARLARESIESNPQYGPITIQTTGDLQAVLDKASQISNDLKRVTRNVPEKPITSTGSGTVYVVADETDETSGTTTEDIEEMIEVIFNAFDTIVDRSQNINE